MISYVYTVDIARTTRHSTISTVVLGFCKASQIDTSLLSLQNLMNGLHINHVSLGQAKKNNNMNMFPCCF